MSPSPLTKHQRIVGRLFAVLHYQVQNHGLGEGFTAPLDVFLNDINIYQPDIIFVSSSRSGQVGRRGIEGAPDLCIEVLSESTARRDRKAKKKVFAETGVIEYWPIDPDAQTLEIYRLRSDADAPVEIFQRSEVFRSEFFPGLDIPLKGIFAGCS